MAPRARRSKNTLQRLWVALCQIGAKAADGAEVDAIQGRRIISALRKYQRGTWPSHVSSRSASRFSFSSRWGESLYPTTASPSPQDWLGFPMPTHTTNLHEHETNQRRKKECELYTTHDLRPASNVIGHRSVLSLYPNGHNFRPTFSHWRAFHNLLITTINQPICIYPRIPGDNREIYWHHRNGIVLALYMLVAPKYLFSSAWGYCILIYPGRCLDLVILTQHGCLCGKSQENTSWEHRREDATEE